MSDDKRPSVAVVVEGDQSPIADALAGVARPIRFTSEADLLQAADGQHFQMVVASPSHCTNAFLAAIERAFGPGAAAFWYEKAQESKLTAAAGHKHVFHVLPSADDPAFAEAAHQWLRPRASVRVSVNGVTCELTLAGGRRFSGELIDASPFGLQVVVPHASLGGVLFPGARVSDLTLWRDGDVILDGVDGVVRHCAVRRNPQDSSIDAYQLGIELVAGAQRQSRDRGHRRTVRDRVQLLGYLRNAVGYSEITARGINEPELFTTCNEGRLDVEHEAIYLTGDLPHTLGEYDTLELSFDLWGKNYTFAATLLSCRDRPEFAVRVPRVLVERASREVARFKPGGGVRIGALLQSPFPGLPGIEADVLDVTTAGCAFEYDVRAALFPLGSMIPNVALRFPGAALDVGSARVRSSERAGPFRVKCGIEFQPLSSLQRAKIYDAIVHCDKPGIRDGSGHSFDELWNFFLDTGFVYPSKLAQIDVPAVRATYEALLEHPTPLAQFILFENEGTTYGHVSALRAYSRTCLAQHLAARPRLRGVSLGRMLTMAMVQFQEYQPDVEWMKLFYRPNNPWPRFVYGSFAQRAADSISVDHRTYDYLTMPITAELAGVHRSVRPMVASDEPLLEAWFIEQGRTAQMRAEDFVSGRMLLADLDVEYGALGLQRRREILVYEEHGKQRGFAALEISSPGLNLSELTSSFRLFLFDSDPEVVHALAMAAAARYAALGATRCVALGEGESSAQLQQLGFQRKKQYASLVWHRSTYGHYSEHVHRVTATEYL